MRRFTVRIRFNRRDANVPLARPGMSVETAVAVSMPDNASPTERGNRVGCEFDPSKDIVERWLTKLPEHPGLGRARPQGPSGTEIPIDLTATLESTGGRINATNVNGTVAGVPAGPFVEALAAALAGRF